MHQIWVGNCNNKVAQSCKFIYWISSSLIWFMLFAMHQGLGQKTLSKDRLPLLPIANWHFFSVLNFIAQNFPQVNPISFILYEDVPFIHNVLHFLHYFLNWTKLKSLSVYKAAQLWRLLDFSVNWQKSVWPFMLSYKTKNEHMWLY